MKMRIDKKVTLNLPKYKNIYQPTDLVDCTSLKETQLSGITYKVHRHIYLPLCVCACVCIFGYVNSVTI